MLYQIYFKEKQIITKSLCESVAVINNYIYENRVCCTPITKNIVANWVSRSKSLKYDWVCIEKL